MPHLKETKFQKSQIRGTSLNKKRIQSAQEYTASAPSCLTNEYAQLQKCLY